MLQNYLYSILRHLRKNKVNTGIHVLGLTLGMTACLLIGLFLRNELNFDRQNLNANRIYRVNSVWKEESKQFDLYATPLPLAEELRNDVAGIEKVVLTRPQFKSVIEIDLRNRFNQEHVLITEPEFLDIFKVDVISGDGYKTLRTPYQALITQTTAIKFFGKMDPIGRTFKYRNKYLITVGGIIHDLPSNTHLPASILLSYAPNEDFLGNGDVWYFGDGKWTKPAACTYVLLEENTNPKNIEKQLRQIANKNINTAKDSNAIRGSFELQALEKIHFDIDRFGGGPWVPAINPIWLWLFAAIGIAVLILACINFFNLSTAQSFLRAKEVGIRKTIGAAKSQLLLQFLGEGFSISLISGFLAAVISNLSLPWLNSLLGKNIEFNFLQSPELVFALFSFIVITALLAGAYPAWIIANFNPIAALKSGTFGVRISGAQWLRKGLVVIQFTISVGLFVTVLTIAQQVNFMRTKELGFEKENIVNIKLGNRNNLEVFSNDLLQIKGVKDISFVRSAPISDDQWWNTISRTETDERQSVCALYADEHFYNVYGLKLLSGRIPKYNESIAIGVKKKRVVVNQKLLNALHLGTPEEAIGKNFWWGDNAEIIGVVADFNVEPLKYSISPTLIFQDSSVYSQVSVRMESGADVASNLKFIETAWKKAFPNDIYEFSFLDSQIDSFYDAETRLFTLFRIFAGIAIAISCLGLWALVIFTAQQRTKEIGIRKVMGATVGEILLLLLKNILVLIAIAMAIASPVTYYFAKVWLQNFAFRIDALWGNFLISGSAILFIAMLTVIIHSTKAALMDPVKSLKNE